MKRTNTLRLLALILCLILSLSLLSTVFAADEIWIEEPLGWTDASQVIYKRVNGHLCNWGVRGETALFLSTMALSYYGDAEWGLTMGNTYASGTGTDNATSSALYTQLHQFLVSKQTHQTSYDETKNLFQYTDCMVSNNAHTSSFYSGRKMKGAWDYPNWNREHTWPKSKASGSQNNDIMMLRPTASQENSTRGNKAYGESTGFYNPNGEANGLFDLRGDCARICLYCYVRWSENAGSMWGASGVMESLDVLLNWMEQDPVDTWEMGRNDAVEDITGVRNVFVDYPELAWKLFGREVPESYPSPMNGGEECPTGHAYGAPEWTWNADNTAATAKFTCANCGDVQTLDAVITETVLTEAKPHVAGEKKLTAKVTFEGTDYTDEKTVAIEALPCPCADFEDMPEYGTPEHEAIDWAFVNGITAGLSATEFGTNKTLNRAQAATFLYAAADKPAVDSTATLTFNDVVPKNWYYTPVLWAASNNLVTGYGDNSFKPNNTLTRAQILTILYAWADRPEVSDKENKYSDVVANNWYYAPAVWAYYAGIERGENGKFAQGTLCTRAAFVLYLYRHMTGNCLLTD